MGYCLPTQDIRKKIKKGIIEISGKVEDNIQMASYEPHLSEQIWEVHTEHGRSLMPKKELKISDLLKEQPKTRHSLKDGFEVKRGHTYVIKLKEKIKLLEGEIITSSPKSSLGRLFPKIRLLADYNPCFDEVHFGYSKEKVELWLLIEPQAFDLILYEDLTLNQLRFHRGTSIISDEEVKKLHKKHHLVGVRNFYGSISEIKNPVIHNGLQLHIDLVGRHTGGVIGLKARKVSSPVDLRKLEHEVKDYFEVITSRDSVVVRPGEFYLFLSKEVLDMPKEFSAELRDHSHIGLNGPLHFAGFIDNGFKGDLVFEVRSDEAHDLVLYDGMPLSRVSFFKTRVIPDKIYGQGKNNYQGQTGPRPSKYFKKEF